MPSCPEGSHPAYYANMHAASEATTRISLGRRLPARGPSSSEKKGQERNDLSSRENGSLLIPDARGDGHSESLTHVTLIEKLASCEDFIPAKMEENHSKSRR